MVATGMFCRQLDLVPGPLVVVGEALAAGADLVAAAVHGDHLRPGRDGLGRGDGLPARAGVAVDHLQELQHRLVVLELVRDQHLVDEAVGAVVVLVGRVGPGPGGRVDLDQLEPVTITNIELRLEGTDLLSDPSLRSGLVHLWTAEADQAGLQRDDVGLIFLIECGHALGVDDDVLGELLLAAQPAGEGVDVVEEAARLVLGRHLIGDDHDGSARFRQRSL